MSQEFSAPKSPYIKIKMNEPKLKLFISQLPQEWKEQTIKEYFNTFGPVLSVSVFKEGDQSKPHLDLGCAYVLFKHRSDAESAMDRLNKPRVSYFLRA